jgi:hypothetical protein
VWGEDTSLRHRSLPLNLRNVFSSCPGITFLLAEFIPSLDRIEVQQDIKKISPSRFFGKGSLKVYLPYFFVVEVGC